VTLNQTLSADEIYDRFAGVRVAVLGASGFIGRWLARQLSQCDADVGLFVRSGEKMRRVMADYEISGEIIECDFNQRDTALSELNRFRPTVTFNAIGYGVDHQQRDETDGHRINAQLVGHLAASLAEPANAKWPGAHFVQLGSALEYGEVGGRLAEQTTPRPTTWYGRTKLAGTRALEEACQRVPGFRGVTARLFMVYGPGENSGRLFPQLIRAADARGSLELSSGEQEKDFTFVRDAAEGCLRLALAGATAGEAVNVATGRLTSVRDFIVEAARQLGIEDSRLEFGVRAVRRGEMQHEPVQVERLEQLTHWRPDTGVADGIRQTIEFVSHLRRGASAADA